MSLDERDRIFVALDAPEEERILSLARLLRGRVGGFKVGLEAFTASGPALVRKVADHGIPVFLDLKLHDIPNTVAGAAAAAARLGVSFLTVHALGGILRMKKGIDRYDLSRLTQLSHMVERYSGITLPRNKPVTGELAFSHESGIHIAAILEDPASYEYFPPDMVGSERKFILGKHTGKRALEFVVASIGCELTDKQVCRVLDLVKDHSEHKCNITPDVLKKLIRKAQEEKI